MKDIEKEAKVKGILGKVNLGDDFCDIKDQPKDIIKMPSRILALLRN